MDGPTDGRNFLDRERSERERERERPAPLLSSPLFSSRCHENGEERSGGTDGRGRRIGDHEQGEERRGRDRERERERAPSRVPLSPRGPPGTRRVIYISPRTYLPTYPWRGLRESIRPFLRHEKERIARWRAREGPGGREAAASFRPHPPFSLFHPRKLHFSCPSFSRRASLLSLSLSLSLALSSCSCVVLVVVAVAGKEKRGGSRGNNRARQLRSR